jgi:hypothetical protein
VPLPRAYPKPCNKSPFSAFTTPLYMALKVSWLGMACGIPEVLKKYKEVKNSGINNYIYK